MTASDHGTDVVTDEGAVRAALAAHPWPRFGEGLQARLMAIATTSPDAPIEANRDVRRPAADSAGPPAAPREMRRWRREVWATGAVMAVVAALAVVLAGTARVRQARPVQGPVGDVSTVQPVRAITDVLEGRLIYVVHPSDGERFSINALDMRTGTTERLWQAKANRSPETYWAVSPDGSRLAVAISESGEANKDLNEGVIYVRDLGLDAPEPQSMLFPERVAGLTWARDSHSLYYGMMSSKRPWTGEVDPLRGWSLHQLTLEDPSVPDVNVFEERNFAQIDEAGLDGAAWAELIGVDEVANRAAVVLVRDGDPVSDVVLLDLATGAEVDRIATELAPLGLNGTTSPSGAELAYLSCTTCEDRDPVHVDVMELATGQVRRVFTGSTTDVQTPGHWTPDGRWLVWQGGSGGDHPLGALDLSVTPALDVRVAGSSGWVIAAAPSANVLLTSVGQLVDLDAVAVGAPAVRSIPWAPPDGFKWDDAQVLAWLPDIEDGAAAAQAPTPVSATTSDPVGTLLASAVVLTPVATVTAADGQLAGVTTLESWSPDGRWLPYWMSSGYVAIPGVEPAQLGFLDARSDTTCVQAGIRRRSHADRIFWQPDGRVVVRVDGVPSIGQPCGALSPLPNSTLALPTARPAETPAWAVPIGRGQQMLANESRMVEDLPVEDRSPDGLWLAMTAPIDGTPWSFRERPRRYITTITSVADGRRVVEKMWNRAESTEVWSPAMAGTWLPNGAYLLFRTADHGPLLFSTDGTAQPAGEALFGVPNPPGDPASWLVRVLWAVDGEDWHAVLEGYGHLRLYHPEVPAVEELSHDIFVGAEDGPLLVIGDDPGPNRLPDPSGRWHVRQLDAIDEPFTSIDAEHAILTMGGRSVAIAPDGRTVALYDMARELVTLHPFADLDADLGRWRLDGHHISQLTWSPDGRALAIEGYLVRAPSDPDGRALFLIHPPSVR